MRYEKQPIITVTLNSGLSLIHRSDLSNIFKPSNDENVPADEPGYYLVGTNNEVLGGPYERMGATIQHVASALYVRARELMIFELQPDIRKILTEHGKGGIIGGLAEIGHPELTAIVEMYGKLTGSSVLASFQDDRHRGRIQLLEPRGDDIYWTERRAVPLDVNFNRGGQQFRYSEIKGMQVIIDMAHALNMGTGLPRTAYQVSYSHDSLIEEMSIRRVFNYKEDHLPNRLGNILANGPRDPMNVSIMSDIESLRVRVAKEETPLPFGYAAAGSKEPT